MTLGDLRIGHHRRDDAQAFAIFFVLDPLLFSQAGFFLAFQLVLTGFFFRSLFFPEKGFLFGFYFVGEQFL